MLIERVDPVLMLEMTFCFGCQIIIWTVKVSTLPAMKRNQQATVCCVISSLLQSYTNHHPSGSFVLNIKYKDWLSGYDAEKWILFKACAEPCSIFSHYLHNVEQQTTDQINWLCTFLCWQLWRWWNLWAEGDSETLKLLYFPQDYLTLSSRGCTVNIGLQMMEYNQSNQWLYYSSKGIL